MSIPQSVLSDALSVIEKAIRFLNTKQFAEIERISNQTIHNSSINQDVVSTSISKLIYGIHKIEQASFQKSIPFPSEKFVIELTKLHTYLERGQISAYEKELDKTMIVIEEIAHEFHLHNLINRAGVKKGKKLYEHGISIAQAAKTMGVSQWELYDYVGKSTLNDTIDDIDKRVAKRLMYTEKIFDK